MRESNIFGASKKLPMKKILALCFWVLFTCATFAQKAKLTWSPESKIETTFIDLVNGDGTDMVKLGLETSGGGVFGGKRTYTPVLTRYNEQMNLIKEKRYVADEQGFKFDKLISLRKNLFLYTNYYDGDAKATTFYCQAIDKTSLETKGKPLSLGTFDAIRKNTQASLSVLLSKDSSKILVFSLAASSKKDNEKYYMGVYDSDMKKLWEKTVELPYADKFVNVMDWAVTNDGKVAIIIKHYDQEVSSEAVSTDEGKVPSYKTKFIVYDKAKPKPDEFVLDVNNKFLHAVTVTDDNSSSITLFGLYKQKYNGYITGYFVATIDKQTMAIQSKTMNDFSPELLAQIKVDGQGSTRERDPGLSANFKLQQVVQRGDGTKDYLLEYYLREIITSSTNSANGTFRTTTYVRYTHGDILDIGIKPEGQGTVTRVPKFQISTDLYWYSSFKAMTSKDKLLLFYNDDKDNIEKDLSKRPEKITKMKKDDLAMAVIDASGKLMRTSILSNRDLSLPVAVASSLTIDNKRIALYARNLGLFVQSKDMLGLLEVTD